MKEFGEFIICLVACCTLVLGPFFVYAWGESEGKYAQLVKDTTPSVYISSGPWTCR